jgi:hypothetical protein
MTRLNWGAIGERVFEAGLIEAFCMSMEADGVPGMG